MTCAVPGLLDDAVREARQGQVATPRAFEGGRVSAPDPRLVRQVAEALACELVPLLRLGLGHNVPTTAHVSSDTGWLDTRAAAAHLGITPRALLQRVQRGQVKPHRLGRRLRFRLADLDALLAHSR